MDEYRTAKICPQCGSLRINWIAGGIGGPIYKCEDCNYVGSFILEVKVKDIEKFQKEIGKNKK
jgi:ribosomal protein L37AE/L43A